MSKEEKKIVATGVYRHFKGDFYRVTSVATHTETDEEFVIYHNEKFETFARPIDNFLEQVDGKPRFVLRDAISRKHTD
jgi:hypothetical protein